MNRNEQTKIAISKKLHSIIKEICFKKGLKMYYLSNRIFEEYIKNNYPNYIKKKK